MGEFQALLRGSIKPQYPVGGGRLAKVSIPGYRLELLEKELALKYSVYV